MQDVGREERGQVVGVHLVPGEVLDTPDIESLRDRIWNYYLRISMK